MYGRRQRNARRKSAIPAAAATEALEERRLLTNYYFASSGCHSSTDDGTQQHPYATISKIGTTITPHNGDRFYLKAGDTFSGHLSFAAKLSNVSVTTWPGSTGRAQINNDAADKPGILFTDSSSVIVSHLHVVGKRNLNKIDGIEFKATTATSDLTSTKPANDKINDCELQGYGHAGISLLSVSDYHVGFYAFTISNCHVHDCSDFGILVGDGNFSTDKTKFSHANITISGCEVDHITGASKRQPIVGSGILVAESKSANISGCSAHDNGALNTFGDANNKGGPVGIWLVNSDSGVIQSCKSYNNHHAAGDGGGFDLDNNTANCTMQYNFSHDNDGAGFLLFAWNGLTNKNNLVRYNISSNDGRLHQGGVRISGAVSDARIFHNTIYMNLSSRKESAAGLSVIANGVGAKPQGIAVTDNIFCTGGAIPTRSIVPGAGFTFKGNDFFSLSAVPEAVPAGNLSTNPMFVKRSATTSGSLPAKDATTLSTNGFAISNTALINHAVATNDGPTRDFYGTSLAGLTLDIGAYEKV